MAIDREVKYALRDLEARIKALEDRPITAAVPTQITVSPVSDSPTTAASNRKMCPKCGVKPNHFFHVKTCKGQQKEQKNGEDADRRRDPGTT